LRTTSRCPFASRVDYTLGGGKRVFGGNDDMPPSTLRG
jgi:hypothetical protein